MKKITIMGESPISKALRQILQPSVVDEVGEADAVIFVIDQSQDSLADMYEAINTGKVEAKKVLCTGVEKPSHLREDITWVKPDLKEICQVLSKI